jgi:hypothetical protein
MEWTPMAHCVVEKGKSFNWAQILAFNIFKNAREAPELKKPGFYMSSYLTDVVCSLIHFPALGWEWNPIYPLYIYILVIMGYKL